MVCATSSCGRPHAYAYAHPRPRPRSKIIIYDVIQIPGPPVFQRATLKNWAWPGDEANDWVITNIKLDH